MEPVTMFLISVGVITVIRSLTRPRNEDTDSTKAIKTTKATKEQIRQIQRISNQARQEIKQTVGSHSAQARALTQKRK